MKIKMNLESWKLAHLSPMWWGWKLHLNFFRNSYHQLSTAFNNCQQLIKMKFSSTPSKVIYVPIFSSLGWFSFSSAVNSCWQLLTANDSCCKKKNGIFIYPLNVIYVPNFSSVGCLGTELECDSISAELVHGPELSNNIIYCLKYRKEFNLDAKPDLSQLQLSWVLVAIKSLSKNK